MKVFVWKSYGEVEVRAAETIEQLNELVESIYKVCSDNVYDEGQAQLDKLYEKWATSDKPTNLRGLVTCMIETVGDDCDMFEYGTGFCELKGA